jgi:hypothetical protein
MSAVIELLSDAERAERDQCDEIIVQGLAGFIRTGAAIATMRDKRLFRETHATIEAYCFDKYGIGRRRAYQLMDSAPVGAELERQGITVNEAQASELAKLPAEKRAEVYRQVEGAHKRVTAALIREAAGEPSREGVQNNCTTEQSLARRLEAIEVDFLDMVFSDGEQHDIAAFEHTLRHLFLEVEARLIRARPQHIETLRPLMAGLERRAA